MKYDIRLKICIAFAYKLSSKRLFGILTARDSKNRFYEIAQVQPLHDHDNYTSPFLNGKVDDPLILLHLVTDCPAMGDGDDAALGRRLIPNTRSTNSYGNTTVYDQEAIGKTVDWMEANKSIGLGWQDQRFRLRIGLALIATKVSKQLRSPEHKFSI